MPTRWAELMPVNWPGAGKIDQTSGSVLDIFGGNAEIRGLCKLQPPPEMNLLAANRGKQQFGCCFRFRPYE